MAIQDALLQHDATVALTASRASTNVIDFSVVRDMGATEKPLMLDFKFITLPGSSGSAATIQVQIQTSADNSSWTTLEESPAVPQANFTALAPDGGIRFRMPSRTSRYLRLNYVVGTENLTSGTVNATWVLERSLQSLTARNYVV